MAYEAPFQLAHTGSGGMTSSLSVGTAGSAAVRKLRQYPLSPILTTGRSDIKNERIQDPRFFNVNVPESQLQAELQIMQRSQWSSRTAAVNNRAVIIEMLQQFEPKPK